MKDIPTSSFNSSVTSPAYWLLRDYEVEGQMGLEPSPQEYINRLVRVFDEVFRVLRDDGTCWVVLGDTYFGRGKGAGYRGPCKENFRFQRKPIKVGGQPKSLALIPSRFAIAMTDRGWILRNRIIWHKPDATPASVKDRFTVDFEEMFFFTKSKRYYFNQQFVSLEPETEGRIERFIRNGEQFDPARHKSYDRQGGMKMMERLAHKVRNGEALAANMRTVWSIPTARCTDAHFAVYPEELITTPILAGCPKGGIVLDPFAGTGTTGIVCEMLGRSFLGIELNPAYVEIAKKRIRAAREAIPEEGAAEGCDGLSPEPKPQGTRGKRNRPSGDNPNDDWTTPDWLFNLLDAEFHFTLDAAAAGHNAKVKHFFSREQNGLELSWAKDFVWLNPPYDKTVGSWVQKAYLESQEGATVVALLPARTHTDWYHQYVQPYAEVRFVQGWISFKGYGRSNTQICIVAIFRPEAHGSVGPSIKCPGNSLNAE